MTSETNFPPSRQRDRSRSGPAKPRGATRRKQAQRARLRLAGRQRIEAWISQARREMMDRFGARGDLPRQGVAELILESATPLYLREVNRRLDLVIPLLQRIRLFERYKVVPRTEPGPPYRIGRGPSAIMLDPHEYHLLLQQREQARAIFQELSRLGIDARFVDIASGGSGRPRRRRSRAGASRVVRPSP